MADEIKDEDDKLPVGDEQPKNWEQMVKFAIAYWDFESPTRGRKTASLLTVYPDMVEDSANRQAYRWLKREDVRALKDEITADRIKAGKMGSMEYGSEMLDIARFLVRRGGNGDAGASAQYAKLAAIALGFHIRQSEDKTPPERKVPSLPTGEMAQKLLEQAQRIIRLQAPVPTARLAEATEVEAEEIKPKRDTPWERPPGPRAIVPAAPQACFVCGVDGFERGDGKFVCVPHALAQEQPHQQNETRPDDYASPEPEPGNPLP